MAVAETAARTVVRHWLHREERPANVTTCVQDLPGYPDNVARGTDGLIWVTSPVRATRWWNSSSAAPFGFRRQVTRIPERVQPKPKRTVRVQAFDDDGRLVHDWT